MRWSMEGNGEWLANECDVALKRNKVWCSTAQWELPCTRCCCGLLKTGMYQFEPKGFVFVFLLRDFVFDFFSHRVSLCNLYWPRTHCVAQSGPHLEATLLLNFPRAGISGFIYSLGGFNFYLPLYFTPVTWIDKAMLQEAPERKHTLRSIRQLKLQLTLDMWRGTFYSNHTAWCPSYKSDFLSQVSVTSCLSPGRNKKLREKKIMEWAILPSILK